MNRARLKRYFYRVLRGLAAERWLRARLRDPSLLVVLNLHRVSPHPNPFWTPLHPTDFEELLKCVVDHYQVTTFGELARPSSRPALVLSFDDGYYDFLEYAAPLLQRYGLRANQNIIPECVMTGRPTWNVQLYDFLNSVPASLLREIDLPGLEKFSTDDDDGKLRFGLAISRFLKLRSRAERAPLWAELTHIMEKAEVRCPTRMMTLPEVRQAATEHEIGVHAFAHDSMRYETMDFFREDFDRCRGFFRDELRLPLKIYAFPNGSHRPEQVRHLEAAGIARILLVEEAFANRGTRVCPRITISAQSPEEARLQSLAFRARRVA